MSSCKSTFYASNAIRQNMFLLCSIGSSHNSRTDKKLILTRSRKAGFTSRSQQNKFFSIPRTFSFLFSFSENVSSVKSTTFRHQFIKKAMLLFVRKNSKVSHLELSFVCVSTTQKKSLKVPHVRLLFLLNQQAHKP